MSSYNKLDDIIKIYDDDDLKPFINVNSAVQIFAPLESQQRVLIGKRRKSKRKMPHTSIAKLIYAAPTPRNTPTKTKVKTIHHYVHKNSRKLIKDNIYQDENKASNYNADSTSAISKTMSNEEFLKKKLEREKEIEEMNDMLDQINANKEIDIEETNLRAPDIINKGSTENAKLVIPLKEDNLNVQSNSKGSIENITNDLKSSKTSLNLIDRKTLETYENDIDFKNNLNFMKDNTNLEFSPQKTQKENHSEIKKKSYTSKEAKNFIKAQKEKWKTDEKAILQDKDKEKLNKNEIKKRLQELHKNSLKILQSNLKRAKKSTSQPRILENVKSSFKTIKLHKSDPSLAKSDQFKNLNDHNNLRLTKDKNKSSMDKISARSDQIDTHKRIGLLRKADSDEPSFSNIKDYDVKRENKILESLVAPKVNLTAAQYNLTSTGTDNNTVIPKLNYDRTENNTKTQNEIEERTSLKSEKSTNMHHSNDLVVKDVENEVSLKIPKVQLESKILRDKSEKSVQVQLSLNNQQKVNNRSKKENDIPFWLKPSPAEIYPYNFITAVRKKLEALTNPVVQRSQTQQQRKRKSHNKGSKNIYQETPLSHTKMENDNVRRRIIDNDYSNASSLSQNDLQVNRDKRVRGLSESLNKGNVLTTNNKYIENAPDKSRSVSEMMSNFSSMSLHVPESNTVSDISSLKSDAVLSKAPARAFLSSTKINIHNNNEQSGNDDTTISSSVFSSPEKKKNLNRTKQEEINEVDNSFSPLSLENITNLQVKSKSNEESKSKIIKSNLPLVLNNKNEENFIENKVSAQNKEKISELDQLLVDFNKSLSQVIEVNNQLKTTLNKSHRLFSPNSMKDHGNYKHNDTPIILKPSTSSITTAADYTSDFEDNASSITLTERDTNISINNQTVKDNLISENIISSKQISKSDISSIEYKLDNSHSQLISQSASKSSIDRPPESDITAASKITLEKLSESTIEEDIQNIEKLSKSADDRVESGNLRDEIKIPEIDLDDKSQFIKNHINTSRGNLSTIHSQRSITTTINHKHSSTTDRSSAPPIYSADENKIEKSNQYLNSSVGSEFIAVYNKSDVEISMFLQDDNQSIASEATLNYSSLGVYEQLLQTENLKSEQLTALLKMREKVLIDRTKGQIAWLEVQKEKYKSKGLTEQISTVKKKQRAILMKMEKEREEIKKLMNNQASNSSNHSSRIRNQHHSSSTFLKAYRPKLSDSISNITIRKGFTTTINQSQSSSKKIVRGFDIGSTSQNLEKILQKREEELRNRRQHVERLMAWHQRLDKEEEEVFQLEQMLLECNRKNRYITSQILSPQITGIVPPSPPPILSEEQLKKEKKIAEIEKSLRELQNVSVCSKENNSDIVDHVRISGHKLNKLWTRLTGQKINKFDPHKKYKLTKDDLEKFYEKAKEKVIEEFNKEHNLRKLLEQSSNEKISNFGNSSNEPNNNVDTILFHSVDVPSLHLNFSSESDLGHTLESRSFQSIKHEQTTLNKNKFENNYINNQQNTSEGSSREIANIISTLSPTHKSEKNTEFIDSLNTTKDQSSPSSSNNSSTKSAINQHLSEDNGTPISEENQLLDKISGTEISENMSETNFSPVVSADKTFVLKQISPDKQKSPEETTLHNSGTETNEISEEIKSIQSNSIETINSERPSVIVSSTSSLGGNDLIKNLKTKTDSTLSEIESSSSISSVTKATDATEKHTPTIISMSLISKIPKSKMQSTDSSNNSNKLLSLISLEHMQSNNQSKSTSGSSIITESVLTISSDTQSINSDISISENIEIMSNIPQKSVEKSIEDSYEYENDFSESDVTNLDDISMPKFETTLDTTKTSFLTDDLNLGNNIESSNSNRSLDSFDSATAKTTELKKRLIDVDDSLKDLNYTIEKVLSPEKDNCVESKKSSSSGSGITSPIISPSVSITLATATLATMKPPANILQKQNNSISTIISSNSNEYDKITLMPDIISEVEIRRRQQILIESEIKQLEHAMPYVVFREIPNKPPPPYVPPAHGSPMTTIFPSQSRIREITFRRTAELFEEISNRNEKSPKLNNNNNKDSILNEQITNIYERIILDICKECMQEYEETLHELNPESYKNPLALYNPPDRLSCMQEFIYRRVRKLLAIEKNYHRKNSIFSICRKKRDHVDEILIQELFEEDYKWTNFDQEEDEVKTSIVDEILNSVIKEVVIETVNRNKLANNSNASTTNFNVENNADDDDLPEENKSLNETECT